MRSTWVFTCGSGASAGTSGSSAGRTGGSLGAGAAAGFGRIASIVAPLTVPFVLERGGASGEVIVFSRFTVAFVGAGAAAWLLPELRGQVLR